MYSEGKGELLLQYSDDSRESCYLCILRARHGNDAAKALTFVSSIGLFYNQSDG